MCQECVSYLFFSYLRELKLSFILCVKVGQNTFYFICNSSGQNLHMHFEESLSIEWVLRLMFWKKAVTWTTMNIAILITNNHTLACISVKCLRMGLYHHNPLSTLKEIWERLSPWQPYDAHELWIIITHWLVGGIGVLQGKAVILMTTAE